ncbi:DUF1206 domain-containing protein [Kamptonema formosum]|uniref:DUF1206 domain-containing protein n=1 Tax=Kamptonema formosum TaxID=331992 RepID=UPI000344F5ED
MTRHHLPNENVTARAQRAASQAAAHPCAERLARFGYAAKGAVYAIVGLLAAQAAFGAGGRTTDARGALETIVTQPFGKFLLSLVAIGLIGFALWRFVQAFMGSSLPITHPTNRAYDQWRTNIFGSDVLAELSTPEQFDSAAEFVKPEDLDGLCGSLQIPTGTSSGCTRI